MTQAAIFAALIAVCAQLCIPVADIALTMQTFAVFLTLGLLGGKWGSVSILLYLLLGAAGLPVFSAFRGGAGVLLGATGGYLWGFLASALVYRAAARFGVLPAMVAGQLACYVCGTVWFLFWSGGGLAFVLLRCVVPYLLPDVLKIRLAYTLSTRLKKHIR